ncbi:MAG TPA: ATP-dependent sacrificial sulfur transferase LarE [Actinomycetota bacterium]|nr:ATP-dependent sacrificial sulfur transferase LarE [Actinomycetota bacterium]
MTGAGPTAPGGLGAPGLVRRLEATIRAYGAGWALVAFSGGVDSSVVLALAVRALGPQAVTAVTAVSPSYPSGELEGARRTARALGVRHRVVATGEVEREAYARNDAWRCFHCKVELYGTLRRLAAEAAGRGAALLAGANADDRADFRPGLLAAGRFGVRNPLLEAGVGKQAVRALARHLGLSVADKPALACLSSRVAFGLRITPELLARIDRAEALVRALGFGQVRVRHFGDRATVEVEEPERLAAHPRWPEARAALRALGWRAVELDPGGYRPGRMNETLGDGTAAGAGRASAGPLPLMGAPRTAGGSGSGPPGSPPGS